MVEYRKLDELCNINMGQSPDSKSYNELADGLPFFQGNADFGDMYPTPRIWCNAPAKVVEPETLLISVRAPIGALNFAKVQSCIGRGLAGITPKKGVNLKYIYYCLKGKNAELNRKGTGSTFKAIAKKDLGETVVKVISEAEQTEIIQILDMISTIIEMRKQQLIELDNLIKARFVEMFGDLKANSMDWPLISLADIILSANNGMARRGNDREGNIVLRLVELQDGYIDYSEPNRIILSESEKQRYQLVDKDFLFARVNGNPANVGRCAVFSDIMEPVYHNDHIIRVHFDERRLNGCFASVLLNSDYGKKQMRGQIKTSAGQYTISQDGLGKIVSILPPLELQQQFAAFVHQVDKSKVVVLLATKLSQLLCDKYYKITKLTINKANN